MSYPNFPNPARRARILQAHQLRQQGLTLREIAKIMGCAHSTVAGYLRDYELFRVDLMRELAADQIVSHAIQLAEVDSEHHDRRLAAMREFRLLLTALPEIRRDEDDRTRELTSGQVHVDRYGNRYATPNRMFPPTQEEQQESLEPPLELPAGRPDPDVALYCPPLPVPDPEPQPTAAQDDHTDDHTDDHVADHTDDQPDQIRTKSNKSEQESSRTSSPGRQIQRSRPKSPDQSIHEAIEQLDQQLKSIFSQEDWHPEREKVLRLIKKKQTLKAQRAQQTQTQPQEDPTAA